MGTTSHHTLEFDGASRGNPGPAAYGFVLRDPAGAVIVRVGCPIGIATNNTAEYRAVIAGLTEARRRGVQRLQVRGDSQLIIRQLQGVYRVKSEDLRPMFEQARKLLREFEEVELVHNLRGHNSTADSLANDALDQRAEVRQEPGGSGSQPKAVPDKATQSGASIPRAGEMLSCSRCGCELQIVQHPAAPRQAFTCSCGAALARA